jgi:putative aminopeptidase FrvX
VRISDIGSKASTREEANTTLAAIVSVKEEANGRGSKVFAREEINGGKASVRKETHNDSNKSICHDSQMMVAKPLLDRMTQTSTTVG